jgi:predicted RNase H-related nuclease YkuK (DUF458 family)
MPLFLYRRFTLLSDEQIEDLIELLTTLDSRTKLYFGCDSVRYLQKGKKFARYATVLIVHMNGNNGCRIFSNVDFEPDYDLKPGRPRMRMINEARRVSDLYLQVAPLVDEFNIEIHLDINTDPKYGSNCAASEAAGYVLGVTGIVPKMKPDSFAASYGADKFAA